MLNIILNKMQSCEDDGARPRGAHDEIGALAKMRMSRHSKGRENGSKIGLVIGLFCGWALSSSALTALLRGRVDLDSIIGMDLAPSQYHRLDVFTRDGTVSI
jgi:coenzyme F420-reducing hydrogenase beta subunit